MELSSIESLNIYTGAPFHIKLTFAMPIMAADPIDILNSVEFVLSHNNAMQDVANALQTINQAVASHMPPNTWKPMQVYQLPVCYWNANAHTAAFGLYLARNLEIQDQFTKAEWDEEIVAYGIVTNAVHCINQHMSFMYIGVMPNLIFSHSFTFKIYGDDSPAAQAAHYVRNVEWHEFVLLLNNRKVYQPQSFPTLH